MKRVQYEVILNDKSVIHVEIFSENEKEEAIFLIGEEEARSNNEAELQIIEGFSYEYRIEDGYYLENSHVFVKTSKIHNNSGRIQPGTFVGRTKIPIYKAGALKSVGNLDIEIRSIKTSYRNDYRCMLKDISDYCIDLVFQPNSPVIQNLSVDFNLDSKTLYQKFAFIRSIIDSDEFSEAISRVTSSPITKWQTVETTKDLRSVKRLNSKSLRQLRSASRRRLLPEDHNLFYGLATIPERINDITKTDALDNPENRFVKYALRTFLLLSDTIRESTKDSVLKTEASLLSQKLEEYLSHSLFKEVANIQSIPFNNPVLQRKDGYREIFRIWLMMSLAAKLIWSAGEDNVYGAGKKDVAILYEYWVFFKLLRIVSELFHLNFPDISKLIKFTAKDISVLLKQGKHIPLTGVHNSTVRKLYVQFSYNRSFSKDSPYPQGGSWTETFRPDYTLSIWPYGLSEDEAETQEIIVHVHFDAKYRIERLGQIIPSIEQVDEESVTLDSTHKRDDLLKMHAYRDAIRRTAGAYIIYPGDNSIQKKGFHELIPGLGAFTLRPSSTNSGGESIKVFLSQVLKHFHNRASQRERYSFKTFDTHREPPKNILNEAIPESIGENRSLIPDETIVLIGYYKSELHLKWVRDNLLYNVRTGTGNGALPLDINLISASYLVLYSDGKERTNLMFKICKNQHKVYARSDLKKLDYPNPGHKNYIVFKLESHLEPEFAEKQWNLKNLKGFNEQDVTAAPFYVTLSELMTVVDRTSPAAPISSMNLPGKSPVTIT